MGVPCHIFFTSRSFISTRNYLYSLFCKVSPQFYQWFTFMTHNLDINLGCYIYNTVQFCILYVPEKVGPSECRSSYNYWFEGLYIQWWHQHQGVFWGEGGKRKFHGGKRVTKCQNWEARKYLEGILSPCSPACGTTIEYI